MQVYWWQAGLHIKPETDEERNVLAALSDALYGLDLDFKPSPRPIFGAEGNHQEAVV